MIKAVLFDLDNTLIDFMRMKKSAISAALDAMIAAGIKLEKEAASAILYKIYDKHGIEYQHVFQEFVKKNHPTLDYRIVAEGIVAYRKVQPAMLQPYVNVIPTLLALKQKKLKLGIVTDAPQRNAWLRLVEMRLQHFFDAVVCFEQTKKLKPSKLPFKKALSMLQVSAENCIMVGDWPERDIKGAKKLGMVTVFAQYGSIKVIKRSGADFDIGDVAELVPIVDRVDKYLRKKA